MKRIMLVDDVEISNFITKRMIEKMSSETHIADFTLPAVAYQSLPQVAPDLIFLDLNMPEIDGWTFLEMMQQDHNDIPVYILTSSTSKIDWQRSRNYHNVKDFLVKPLSKDVLVSILGLM